MHDLILDASLSVPFGRPVAPFLPHDNSLQVVVGKALQLPRIANPTTNEVKLWHGKYMEELEARKEKRKKKGHGRRMRSPSSSDSASSRSRTTGGRAGPHQRRSRCRKKKVSLSVRQTTIDAGRFSNEIQFDSILFNSCQG